mmetsp:Transcript_88086/g.247654  ORF Transcript_88086/g.247654 Transcript_88086/m.247654 type:complete len:271 (+) Transcript_88086:478-1290(+)
MRRVRRIKATDHKAQVDALRRLCDLSRCSTCRILHFFGRELFLRACRHQLDAHLLAFKACVERGGRWLVLSAKHFVHRVLPLLGRVTNRVEGHVVIVDTLRPELLDHHALEKLPDEFGLALHHRGLVSDTELVKVDVGVKAISHRLLELRHEFLAVPAAKDVLRDVLRFLHVFDDEVFLREGFGGHCFFVVVLAVDNGGVTLRLALLHRSPDLGDPWASGVDDGDLAFLQKSHLVYGSAEGWKDDDIALSDDREVLLSTGGLFHELHAHI